MSRLFIIILAVVLVLGLVIFFSIVRFLKKNDAPALHGKINHSIQYKEGLKLDVYQPTRQVYEKSPVLVYIHGGAWISGSKISVNNARFNGAFNTLREKGYAVVSPDYTLAKFGKSPFPACLADAFDAVKWMEDHADAYNFDLNNVGLLGESAGAHIALVTAYSSNQEYTTPNNIDFHYVIDVYGPTHLLRLYKDQTTLLDSINTHTKALPASIREHLDITQYLFGFNPEEDSVKTKEFTSQYSPINEIKKGVPNTLLIHGDKDRVVPVSQTHLLKERLDDAGIPNELHILDGVDHAFLNATQEQKDSVQQWITDFVLAHYK